MVAAFGHSVHVGCQSGADQSVISAAQSYLPLHVFVVNPKATAPAHVLGAVSAGQAVGHFCAGGTSAPIHARYLLRSIAAFQGCSHAVFFSPGAGSLAVAREFIAHFLKRGVHPCNGIPLFAFSPTMPAAVPSVSGSWVASSFLGFPCWQWSPAQLSLF